jgi:hypothetical protein
MGAAIATDWDWTTEGSELKSRNGQESSLLRIVQALS